jgi:hypothetical protein
MSNRTAKFASFAFASFLAGALVATISDGAARAADDCLSAPKDETPSGAHWYYRIEHRTQRHCWYLRAEGGKPAQAALPNPSPPATPVAPKAEASAPRSIADAHAELPPQAPAERQIETNEPNPALTPRVPGIDNVQGADAADLIAPSSIVVSRWPKPSSVSPALDTQVATSNATPMTPPASAAAPSAPAPVALAPAADSSTPGHSAQAHSGSILMLLTTMAGALAASGIVGGIILKFGARRRPRQARLRARRGVNWEPTDDDRIVLPARPGADALRRRTGFGRTGNRSARSDERAAEFFSHLSRRNQA